MGKSSRNKTIDTTVEQGREFLGRCLCERDLKDLEGASRDEIMDAITDRTVCGDFFSASRYIPDSSADLVIADPPYNMRKRFNNTSFRRLSEEEYEGYTRRWMSIVDRMIKKEGTIYVCCDWRSSLIVGRVLGEFFHVRNRITWQRDKGRGSRRNWKNGMEDVWFATKSGRYTFNADDVKIRRAVAAPYRENDEPKDWEETENGKFRNTFHSNFWDDITIPFWSMPENTAHPTQKPEKLIAKLVLASSSRGDLVFDPFAGSGTTSVTAKKLGRRYLGVEKDEQYCIWAEQRLDMAGRDDRIQGYENGVFWERNAKR